MIEKTQIVQGAQDIQIQAEVIHLNLFMVKEKNHQDTQILEKKMIIILIEMILEKEIHQKISMNEKIQMIQETQDIHIQARMIHLNLLMVEEKEQEIIKRERINLMVHHLEKRNFQVALRKVMMIVPIQEEEIVLLKTEMIHEKNFFQEKVVYQDLHLEEKKKKITNCYLFFNNFTIF